MTPFRLETQRGLYELVRGAATVQRARHWHPASHAPAATTQVADERWSDASWGQRPLRDAYLAAALPLVSAQDHVELLAHCIGTGPLAHAYSTVARGAMEAAGRAWWLLEPDLDDSRRLGRYMTDRLYSWHETVRLAAGISDADPAAGEEQVRKIERVGACAERHGFLVRTERRLAVAIGEPRPSSMKLLDAILADADDGVGTGSTIYRMLSASAHATLYGLLRPTQVVQRHTDGSALAGVAVDDEQLAQITLGPVLAFSRAITAFSHQWGWDVDMQDWGLQARDLATTLARSVR